MILAIEMREGNKSFSLSVGAFFVNLNAISALASCLGDANAMWLCSVHACHFAIHRIPACLAEMLVIIRFQSSLQGGSPMPGLVALFLVFAATTFLFLF
jgi:hypothetical protein